MGLRASLKRLQFGTGTPNTVLGWGSDGIATEIGVFTPATDVADGTIGLVPKPVAGQELYILSNQGWIAAPSGGGGSINGSGTAGRISYWTDADTLASKNSLLFDATNDILKVSTINIARVGFPAGGSADGDMSYSDAFKDVLVRIGAIGIGLTRQGENILDSGTTLYILTETDRNKYVETTSNSPVTIQLPNLSEKFGCTIVKGGNGDVTLTVTGSPAPALVATASVITELRGAAAVFHSNSTTNIWKAYGNLG